MKHFLFYLANFFIIVFLIIGCNSNGNTEDMSDAKTATELSKEEQRIMHREYKAFKLKAYDDIRANDKKIDRLMANIIKSGNTIEESRKNGVVILKEENIRLRERLFDYNLNTNDWYSFKAQFSLEMQNVSNTYVDLFSGR